MTSSRESSYEDDSNLLSLAQWPSQGPSAQSIGSGGSSTNSTKTSSPLQKRRRVTRACDECRRKKIKCDGKQPCTHCTVYSYDCTYDQPSNRRRNPAPQYIEALEIRLQRAESILRTLVPDLDLNDPNFDVTVKKLKSESHILQTSKNTAGTVVEGAQNGENEPESLLESMVEATGRLDLDDQGHVDYHGHSSGFTFLQRLREQFGTALGPENVNMSTLLKFRRPPTQSMFDSPKSGSGNSPMDSGLPNTADLPSRQIANLLVEHGIDDACCLMRFVHKPTFLDMADRIYETPAESYGDEENKFLPCLYACLAVGTLYVRSEQNSTESVDYESTINEGYKYYKAARQIIDATECRDLTSLQTVLFMIVFLQSSAKMSTCYSLAGIALTSSLRMGLHRSVSMNFNPIIRETRKRIFWCVRKMDTYITALLGLPKTISDEDIDQELPLEIDDEYITKDQILPMPKGQVSLLAPPNYHLKIMQVLAKVVKYVYPIKGVGHGGTGKSGHTYKVSHARIREIQRDLQEWMESLPPPLLPGAEGYPQFARSAFLLRMAYSHVQMVLYRPFLHYISPNFCSSHMDERSYLCAKACIEVSRNIIRITEEMRKRESLNGVYWFTMYTTFFAILALVFFAIENPDHPLCADILRDAYDGRDTLASLALRSQAADRCTQSLGTLLDSLPERSQRGRERLHRLKKKRQAPSPSPSAGLMSQSNLGAPSMTDKTPERPQRANTTPAFSDTSTSTSGLPSLPFQAAPIRANSYLDPYKKTSYDMYSDMASDASTLQTPESANTPQHQPRYFFPRQMEATAYPDFNTFVFSHSDPFAYPNTPMTIAEGTHYKQERVSGNNSLDDPNGNPMFLPVDSTAAGVSLDELEVQLFNPLPTYLMEGQQSAMYVPDGTEDMGSVDGMNMMDNPNGFTNNIFGVDEWNELMTTSDQGYRPQYGGMVSGPDS